MDPKKYLIDFETGRRFKGKLREQKIIFAINKSVARKMMYAWARFHKKFVTIKSIDEQL